MRAARTPLAVAAILVAGAGLGACASHPAASGTAKNATSGTTTSTSSGASTRTTHGTTTTGSPATSSTTTSTTSAPPTTAGTPTCQAAGLRIVLAGSQAAAGTEELTFSLTSTASAACEMVGYPGLVLVSTSGAHLPTTVVRGGTLPFENVAPSPVLLAHGETAYFNVGFSVVQSGSTSCTDAQNVEVTPPTGTGSATVRVPVGVHACDDGTLHVSAVFSSTDSAATQTTAG